MLFLKPISISLLLCHEIHASGRVARQREKERSDETKELFGSEFEITNRGTAPIGRTQRLRSSYRQELGDTLLPSNIDRSLEHAPLACNTRVNLEKETCTTPWTDYFGTNSTHSNEVVIECGDCVVFDYDLSTRLVLQGGLDVQGKLVFPSGTKAKIETPYVRVQGYLNAFYMKPVDGQEDLTFILTNNDALTETGSSSKQFLVQGGQVAIHGLPTGTPTKILIHDVDSPACGINGVVLNETFSSPDSIKPYNVFGLRDEEATHEIQYRKRGFVTVKDRTNHRHGLEIALDKFTPCLLPDTSYILTAMVRLKMASEEVQGSPTECASTGEGCVKVRSEFVTVQEDVYIQVKYRESPSLETKYGEWWFLTAEFDFWDAEVAGDNLSLTLSIEGPGQGVDLELDNIVLRTASPVDTPPQFMVTNDIEGKWDAGAKVVVSSRGSQGKTRTIKSITNHANPDFVVVTLDRGIEKPTTFVENPDQVTEVVLLSRNVGLEGDTSDGIDFDDDGAFFLIQETPKVKQTLNGVTFRNFGKQGDIQHYCPINMYKCGDVSGTQIANNLILESKFHCIDLQGSTNVKMHDNMACDSNGYCFATSNGNGYSKMKSADASQSLMALRVGPQPPPIDCRNIVYNGWFTSGVTQPWTHRTGGDLWLFTGSDGKSKSALYAKAGSPMQSIKTGCLEAGKVYEASLNYKLRDSAGKKVVCGLNCPTLILRTNLGSTFKSKTIAQSAGMSDATNWFSMYGIFTANDMDANPNSKLRIQFNDMKSGQELVIDDVVIKEKRKDCSGELTKNSNLQRGFEGYWKVQGSGVVSQVYVKGTKAVRISRRKTTRDGLAYQANDWMDFRCIESGRTLDISMDLWLFQKGTTTSVWCDRSTTSVGGACPSLRIYGFDASSPKESAWSKRLYTGAYNAPWDKGNLNRFRASVTVPSSIKKLVKLNLIVRDFNANYDLAVDNFSIRLAGGTVGPPPTPRPTKQPSSPTPPSSTPLPTKRPTRQPTRQPTTSTPPPTQRPPPTPPPTRFTIPPGAKNNCPDKGKSVSISDRNRPFTSSADLCTLTKIKTDSGGNTIAVVPVARSYDGNDWEAAGGAYAASLFSKTGIQCSSGACGIPLPALESGEVYVLSRYGAKWLTQKERRARFLEMATFGTTKTDLNQWNFANDAAWVRAQIFTPLTSHREYWRSRANPRWQFSQSVGRSIHPCDVSSRWRKFTLTDKDLQTVRSPVSGVVFIKNTTSAVDKSSGKVVPKGPYILYVDGRPRTVVKDFRWAGKKIQERFPTWDPNHGYFICQGPSQEVGGPLLLKTKKFSGSPDGSCQRILSGQPSVNFTGFESLLQPNLLRLTSDVQFKSVGKDMYVLRRKLSYNLCDKLPEHSEDFDAPVFATHPGKGLLQWDPALKLERNTADAPIADGGGSIEISTGGMTICSNAPRTYLNADKCKISFKETACGLSTPPDVKIQLNRTSILKLHQLTGRYLYGIKGLTVKRPQWNEQVRHPCTKGTRSRWERIGTTCNSPAKLGTATKNTLSNLLSSSKDTNPFVRDIVFKNGLNCASTDKNVEIDIQVGNNCWRHVHPEYLSVFDMTYWTLIETHPGNKIAAQNNRKNPIKKWLDSGNHFLEYPSNHPLSRWDIHHPSFNYVGRFGDTVNFRDLPNELRLEQVVDHYGIPISQGKSVVVCGSTGEIAGDGLQGPYFDVTSDAKRDTTDPLDFARQRETVWTMVVLYSNDQLRQRMAWALSQILAIAKTAIAVHETDTEPFLQYYDIFVRHAFGSYLDILRDISYSPLMAENLSYIESKSSAYVLDKYGRFEFADENFAREIMQLFTTGLILLNLDGTPKLDDNGNTQQVYNNDDIRSIARSWTGFLRQEQRGNIESFDGENRIDPMRIEAEWRDRFPKSDLHGGFIGDGYPLCRDLPKKQFLRKGAAYRLLASAPLPTLISDNPLLKQRFVLNTKSSSLRARLCSIKDGKCRYPAEVVLDRKLPCDGKECKVDTVRVVQVAQGIFYEYVEPPCVEHPFINNAMKLKLRGDNGAAVCADPGVPHATSACCELPLDRYIDAISDNLYEIERMTFATQDARCKALGRKSCEYARVDNGAENYKSNEVFHWAFTPCPIQVKVNPIGEAAIVHNVPHRDGNLVLHVHRDTTNYFKVAWKDNRYPHKANSNCGPCNVIDGDSCLCDTTVQETMVFNKNPADRRSILATLRVGAPDPTSFDSGTYTTKRVNGFTVHMRGSGYSRDTIFEVPDAVGRTRLLKNVRSTVQVEGGYSFRNPVHFMSLVPSETNARDAMYETEALLQHLFYHDNTAPFLCVRLIQRFGISNPSPAYVKKCSTAFRTGSYQSNGISFGKRKYGDLAATAAAILLDREARSVVLDADASQGSVREPILRVMSVMRNLEFEPKAGYMPIVKFNEMNEHIGQMAHEIESVFSFFLPEYKPDGPVSAGSLVAPEAQMLDMPKVINLINGMHSMIKYGLSSCDFGFGFDSRERDGEKCADDGSYKFSTGKLMFKPAGKSATEIVDELSTLLTSGRLDDKSRRVIVTEYNNAVKQAGAATALRVAQQLITTTPEFHTINTVKFSGKARPEISPPSEVSGGNYRAIVMLMFEGGCDSFNMIVPRTCSNTGGGDAYSRYVKARRPEHLTKESLLPISGSGQVGCSQFGLHEKLPMLQKLYNDKNLLFFANTGVLGKPSSKDTYVQDTPTQLFAHNTMQRETKVVDVFDKAAGTGVLGRLANALSMNGQSVGLISIDSSSIALVGRQGVSPSPITLSNAGVNRFMPQNSATMTKASMVRAIEDLNNATKPDSGFMASTWSSSLVQSLFQNEDLFQALKATSVSQNFGESDIGKRFEIVARLIKTRGKRGKNADVFYIECGSWDHHNGLKEGLAELFAEVNEAVTAFVAEMKKQGMWSSTTVVQVSDFGRTLTPNSGGGTDHAWGGNYFMFGGSVKGGRILGQYPADLSENAKLNLGRGRFLPTTSWDQIWPGIARWAGVWKSNLLDMICPNRRRFPSEFSLDQLFRTG